jgi:chloride channel 3/4/5
MGRIFGIFMYDLNEKGQFVSLNEDTGGPFVNGIHPGMYAMLGAAGVLGGVCRVTISLVVIMFELTGGLQLIVPFMVVCMLAKWVGDHFTPGIYDYAIEVRKYPFLHEPDEVTFHANAGDVMDVSVDCLHPEMGTCGKLIEFLEKAKHGGYPVTVSPRDNTLLGYMHTTQLLQFLTTELEEKPMVSSETRVTLSKFLPSNPMDSLDVSDFIDEAVIVVVKETPAAQLQQIFRCLGVKLCLVRHNGQLIGMITKKAFIHHMEQLHHSDHVEKAPAHIGSVDLNAPLLPK